MNVLYKSRPILIGLAAGILLALFIAPQTRWVERYQVGAALFMSRMNWGIGFKSEPSVLQMYGPIARAHPDDYQIQLAYTVMSARGQGDTSDLQTGDPRVADLRGLIPRFGENPSLYANILRFSTQYEMRIGYRPEDWLIGGQTPPTDALTLFSEPSSARVLADYDRDAAAGEQLDPQNAYFPFMRAWGLYGQHKDDQAVAELLRAGRETRFDDYSTDQVEGEWKLNEDLVGGKASLPRLAFEAALLFPHYARMREVARIVTYKAILLERSGQTARALAIRNALMHTGSLMRVQSSSLIGTLVGIAITDIAMARPGGAPYVAQTYHQGVTAQEINDQHVDKFCAYLTRIRRSDEIPWVRAESAAGEESKALLQAGVNTPFPDVPMRTLPWWAADMLLLWTVFWLIVLGIAATILSRDSRVREGRPLPAETQWGIAVASVAAVAGAVAAMINADIAWLPLIVLIAAIPFWVVCLVRGFQISVWRAVFVILAIPASLLLLALLYAVSLMPGMWPPAVMSVVVGAIPVLMGWLLLPRGKELLARIRDKRGSRTISQGNRWPVAMAFLATLVAITAVLAAAYWQIRQGSDIVEAVATLGSLNGLGDQSNGGPSLQTIAIAYFIAAIFCFLILPGCVMSIVALVKKQPVSVALINGYRAWSVPLACILLIAYGPVVLITAERENAADRVLEQTVQHEGQYLAQLSGRAWPGAVPYPDPALTAPAQESNSPRPGGKGWPRSGRGLGNPRN